MELEGITNKRALQFELLILFCSDFEVVAEAMQLSDDEDRALELPRQRSFSRRIRSRVRERAEETFGPKKDTSLSIALRSAAEEAERSRHLELVESCKDALEGFSTLSEPELKAAIDAKRQEILLSEEAARLPNRQEAQLADVGFWARVSKLSSAEAVLLSMGREPTEELIRYLADVTEQEKAKSAFLTEFTNTKSLLDNAFGAGVIPDGPNILQILDWFERFQLPFPKKLSSQIREFHDPTSKAARPKPEQATDAEKKSLLKLVAAMAAEQYGFDPNGSNGIAVTNVLNDIEIVGLKLDRKTVAKWLAEATDLIPKDYFKEK